VTKKWNGQSISCHNATIFWLFQAEIGRQPTLNEYADLAIKYRGITERFVKIGSKLAKPNVGMPLAPAGTVLVFANGSEAGHTCVLKDFSLIGGYNQQGWFNSTGISACYSTHSINDIRWEGDLKKGWTVRAEGKVFRLLGVPEMKARQVIRGFLPPTLR
jgi:hypothetical protein